MVAVPFPLTACPGRFDQAGGLLVNAYAEKRADGRVQWTRSPGLERVDTISGVSGGCRGMIEVNGSLYRAYPDALYVTTKSGDIYTTVELGELPGSDVVYFARNNKQPTPDIVAVTNSSAYRVLPSSAPVAYPDSDVGSPNCVAYIGGYFIFSYGNAGLLASGLNTTTINALDYATAESVPDGVTRIIQFSDTLVTFGPQSIEIWRNTGEAEGFPLSRLAAVPRGLAAPGAVAGHEAGFANTVIFCGDDCICYRLEGANLSRVSTHEIERLIQSVADKSALSASVYMHSGHACWALSCDEWTIVYDVTTGFWHERESAGLDRWRASHTVRAFDAWVSGDLSSGKLFRISENAMQEDGAALVATVVSATMSAGAGGAVSYGLSVDIGASVGDEAGSYPIETDPVVSLSWSLDGGGTFGSPVLRDLPRLGVFDQRITVSRLGLSRAKGVKIKVEYSDPVPVLMFGGDLTAQKRA